MLRGNTSEIRAGQSIEGAVFLEKRAGAAMCGYGEVQMKVARRGGEERRPRV
jgi:hypothetical protein